MNKKVVHTALYYFKLSENWIHTQLKHLQEWDPLVLTNEAVNLDTVDWRPEIYARRQALPPVIRDLDSVAMKLLGYYPSFLRQARRVDARLVHAHFGPMGFLSLGIARHLNIPLVTTFYGYDASELPQQDSSWMENYRLLFEQGQRFLVEGPAMATKLQKLGCSTEKITIQHLGIEPGRYPQRSSYHSDQHLRILMVGRFVEKKGFIFGLKAFHRFRQEGGKGTLTIVGDSSESASSQAIKEKLTSFVERHGLGAHVQFKGLLPLDQLRQEYYNHELFLAPSVPAGNGDDEGGLPVTIVEAAATGMALMGSRHCDIPEVIRPGRTGVLVAEKDVDALVEGFSELSAKPPLREAYGEAAARLVKNDYNARTQGWRLKEIYDELLRG